MRPLERIVKIIGERLVATFRTSKRAGQTILSLLKGSYARREIEDSARLDPPALEVHEFGSGANFNSSRRSSSTSIGIPL
jgi:hypothetical protein